MQRRGHAGRGEGELTLGFGDEEEQRRMAGGEEEDVAGKMKQILACSLLRRDP
jgi:hypothetical protein